MATSRIENASKQGVYHGMGPINDPEGAFGIQYAGSSTALPLTSIYPSDRFPQSSVSSSFVGQSQRRSACAAHSLILCQFLVRHRQISSTAAAFPDQCAEEPSGKPVRYRWQRLVPYTPERLLDILGVSLLTPILCRFSRLAWRCHARGTERRVSSVALHSRASKLEFFVT